MSEHTRIGALREPTDEQLLAIEAARHEGAPDGLDLEGGDAQ